jgi:hypothetical protein
MSLYELDAARDVRTEPRAARGLSYVAARSWWMLKTHVAESHGLPRNSAGPEPKPPPRG